MPLSAYAGSAPVVWYARALSSADRSGAGASLARSQPRHAPKLPPAKSNDTAVLAFTQRTPGRLRLLHR